MNFSGVGEGVAECFALNGDGRGWGIKAKNVPGSPLFQGAL